jgi:hypothetical protein
VSLQLVSHTLLKVFISEFTIWSVSVYVWIHLFIYVTYSRPSKQMCFYLWAQDKIHQTTLNEFIEVPLSNKICYLWIRIYIYYCYGSTALCWALTAFSVSWSYTQPVGLIGWGISLSQGRYQHTEQHKHRINAHNTNIHALGGIRTHDPSVRASEDSSCLRPRGHCDRRYIYIYTYIYKILCK